MWKLQYTQDGAKAVPKEMAFDYGCWIAPDSKIYDAGSSYSKDGSPHNYSLQNLALHDIVKTDPNKWRIDRETDEEYYPNLMEEAMKQGWVRVGLYEGIMFFEGSETGFARNISVVRKLVGELISQADRVVFDISRRTRSFQIPKQRIEMFTFLDSLE